jgi:hypothetical protein
MKKVLSVIVAGMFSVGAAAYACDGKDHNAAKAEKAAKVVKKDTKPAPSKDQKKS